MELKIRECEMCGNDNIIVADTRETKNYIVRMRKCVDCGATFSTREYRVAYFKKIKQAEEQAREIAAKYENKVVKTVAYLNSLLYNKDIKN